MIDAPTSSEMSIVSTQDRWSPLRNPSTHEQQLMGIASAFALRATADKSLSELRRTRSLFELRRAQSLHPGYPN